MKLNKLTIILVLGISSCGETYTPKPMEYFRIDLPPKAYTILDTTTYPYRFEYPVYARIEPYDTAKNKNAGWLNIQFPSFKATLHITYYVVEKNLYKYTEESRSLAYKHDIKADAIREIVYIDTLNKVYGMVYEIKGNAASPVQFYLTDSTKHFIRGSLYFNVKPNKDSLAPVIEFLFHDIKRLIETVRWK